MAINDSLYKTSFELCDLSVLEGKLLVATNNFNNPAPRNSIILIVNKTTTGVMQEINITNSLQ